MLSPVGVLLVVVRYSEPESHCGWIDSLVGSGSVRSAIVFNKGNTSFLCKNATSISVRNDGREGRTYLDFITRSSPASRQFFGDHAGFLFSQANPSHFGTEASEMKFWLDGLLSDRIQYDCFGDMRRWSFGYGNDTTRVPSIQTSDDSLFCPGATFFVSQTCLLSSAAKARRALVDLSEKRTHEYAMERSWGSLFAGCNDESAPKKRRWLNQRRNWRKGFLFQLFSLLI